MGVTALSPSAAGRMSTFDVEAIRREFPSLAQQVNGKDLVYLDSAASSLRCRAAIDAVHEFLSGYPANVHRGVHALSQRATAEFERARKDAARVLGAASHREVVFVRGTTEAMNLVAWSFLRPRLEAGDEILVSGLEHHSNLVSWQIVAEERGAKLVAIPIDDRGDLDLEGLGRLISPKTKLIAVSHISNSLGTVVPVAEICALARRHGVPVAVDGAQAVPHIGVDVQALGCDFYAFSGHKVFGPNGIGVLWGKAEHLKAMPPREGGGGMIRTVTFEKTTFADPPERFEAGTPNVEGAIGLGAALRWWESVRGPALEAHEHALVESAVAKLRAIPGLRIIGEPRQRASLISFVLDGIHPHDAGTILDAEGVAVRAGHHCAQPVMERFSVAATIRASFGPYSRMQDVDALVRAVARAQQIFGVAGESGA
jgi:cysteine desulfurase/selenocysteine lyase